MANFLVSENGKGKRRHLNIFRFTEEGRDRRPRLETPQEAERRISRRPTHRAGRIGETERTVS